MQVASCDARPRTREESNPRPAGPGSRRANHETTPEDQFEQQKAQTTSNFPQRAPQKSKKNLEFLHLDHADPRRGSRGNFRNRKKPRVFAPRPRIPAEGRAGTLEITRNHGFCTSTTPIPAERGSRKHRRNRKKTMGFCTSTTRISAEGRTSTAEIAKNHGFLHLDHADPRRGLREHRRNRKKPWVFAPRPRRSPQRVDFRVVSSALPRRPKKRF